MRGLEFPKGGIGRTLSKLVAAKRGPRRAILLSVMGYAKQRYALYLKRRNALENLAPVHWTDDEREALLHCYSTASTTLTEVKESVFKCLSGDELSLCPYCLLRPPQHIDHYLGAARFPEFSTLRINLIWVCGTCNGIKGDGFTGAPRSVINPYFDAIPADIAILYCRVAVQGGELKIDFGIPNAIPAVSPDMIALARRHCNTFSLYKAYAAEASAMMGSWLRELAARFPQGVSQGELQNEIGYQIARSSEGEPINSWYPAMWFGVANCVGIYAYVSAFIAAQPARVVAPPRARNRDLLNWF